MERCFGYARNLPLPGVLESLVQVDVYYTGTNSHAPIYSNNLTPPTAQGNPFTTDQYGFWYFYAPVGRYDVAISTGTGTPILTTYTLGDILLFDPGVAFITSISPTSGPTGTTVTIVGTGFGAAQGSSTLTFNGVVTTVLTWGATSITAVVPYTNQEAYSVSVVVGGTASPPVLFTVIPSWINVRSFGATGNGTTDDTAAIQAAVNSVTSAEGIGIYFPTGSYIISSPILMTSATAVNLFGDGEFQSVIIQVNQTTALQYNTTVGGQIYYANLHDLGIVCRNQTGWPTSGTNAIEVIGSGYFYRSNFENLMIAGAEYGINLHGSLYAGWNEYRHIRFENFGLPNSCYYGFFSSMGGELLMHDIVSFCARAIWMTTIFGDFTISGMNHDGGGGSTSYGIYLDGSSGQYAANFTITGCKLDNTAYPIYILDCEGFQVIGNVCGSALSETVTLAGNCMNYLIDLQIASGVHGLNTQYLILGPGDYLPSAPIKGLITANDTTTPIFWAAGQDSAHNVQLGWRPQPSSANGLSYLQTANYNNSLLIDASVIGIQAQSGFNVGIGTAAPAASALLDMESTTQGFRPPSMTTTQKTAISAPADGLLVYDTTLHKLSFYSTGTATWQTVTSA